MKFTPRLRAVGVLLAATSLGIAMQAEAHGIWFAQRARQIALIYGVGADDLDMVRRLPLIESVTAYDASFQPVAATARVAGPIVVVDTEAQSTLIAAVMQNGVWSKKPNGEWEGKGRDEVPDAVLSERTIKYAVSLQGPLDTVIPVLPTQKLQIVPVGALPATLGSPMTYRVLYSGQPLAGARVINDMVNDPDAREVATGADGTVTLPVRNQGLNVIRAVFSGPTDDARRYDRIEHTATLAFTLPHAPE